jgi:hypothetical protein
MLSRVCAWRRRSGEAREVLIGRLRASAHHEVNSKLFEVLRVRRDAVALVEVLARVVLE